MSERLAYFITARPHPSLCGPTRIKIGCSIDIPARRQHCDDHSPLPLEVIATLPGGYNTEAWLHSKFRHLKCGIEWFAPGPDLLAFIEDVKAGRVEPPDENWTVSAPRPDPAGVDMGLWRSRRIPYERGRRDRVLGTKDAREAHAALCALWRSSGARPSVDAVACRIGVTRQTATKRLRAAATLCLIRYGRRGYRDVEVLVWAEAEPCGPELPEPEGPIEEAF